MSRILLVDDDAMIVELLTLRLEAQGYEVRTAADGAKAYDVAAAFKPHVIICDVVMPKVDGPTFCRRVRSEIEIVVETTWRSLDAIRAFAGPDLESAVVAPEAAALLTNYDRRVHHSEIAVMDRC